MLRLVGDDVPSEGVYEPIQGGVYGFYVEYRDS